MNINAILPENFKTIQQQIAEENYASQFAGKILQQVQAYDESLGDDYEVGVRLVSFGQTVIFAVHSIGYNDPSLIVFNGVADDGSPIELIQHISQISFLLTSLDRKNKDQPKRRIGFYKDEG